MKPCFILEDQISQCFVSQQCIVLSQRNKHSMAVDEWARSKYVMILHCARWAVNARSHWLMNSC